MAFDRYKESKISKLIMNIFMVFATITMVVAVTGFVVSQTVFNPAHIKSVVLTDESVRLTTDALNGIVTSSLKLGDAEYDEDFFEREFVETFIEDLLDTIVFGRSNIDSAYYDDYINNDLFPRIEEITGIDITEQDKLGIMEGISGTLQNESLTKIGNFALRRIGNAFKRLRGIVMGISIGAFCTCIQIFMFMFFAFRNRFIAIKDTFLSTTICFGANLVFFGLNQLMLNGVIGKLSDVIDVELVRSLEPGIRHLFLKAVIILGALTVFSVISLIVSIKLMRKRVFVVARLTKEEKKQRKAERKERRARRKDKKIQKKLRKKEKKIARREKRMRKNHPELPAETGTPDAASEPDVPSAPET